MTTDLAVRNVELSNEQLQFIAHTEFVPPGLRGNVPAILACVATGRALGLADMTALRSIHVIDGKATFSAELMVMLVRRAGHSIIAEQGEGFARATGKRIDNNDTVTVVWTLEMAERAGLLGKSNWKKYPESMLWARAASQLCRMLFPDCFAGATYTPEELEVAETDGNAQARGVGDPDLGATQGSAGEPTPDFPGVESKRHDSASGAQVISGESPASPADKPCPWCAGAPDEVVADCTFCGGYGRVPLVDMSDPDIPFGDAPPAEGRKVRYISKDQRTRLFTIAGKAGVPTEPDVRAIVREFTGQESTKLIPAGQVYDGIISAIQAKAQPTDSAHGNPSQSQVDALLGEPSDAA